MSVMPLPQRSKLPLILHNYHEEDTHHQDAKHNHQLGTLSTHHQDTKHNHQLGTLSTHHQDAKHNHQ